MSPIQCLTLKKSAHLPHRDCVVVVWSHLIDRNWCKEHRQKNWNTELSLEITKTLTENCLCRTPSLIEKEEADWENKFLGPFNLHNAQLLNILKIKLWHARQTKQSTKFTKMILVMSTSTLVCNFFNNTEKKTSSRNV